MRLDPKITEKQFQDLVLDWAKRNQWLAYHTYDSRRSQKGFPDLVLVRGSSVLFWELKSETGKPSADQEKWVAALHAAGQEVRILRPSDWPWIVQRLSRHAA